MHVAMMVRTNEAVVEAVLGAEPLEAAVGRNAYSPLGESLECDFSIGQMHGFSYRR
jgi:hypothetical protein